MDQEKPVEVSMVLGYGDFSLELNGVILKVRGQSADGQAPALHLALSPGLLPARLGIQAEAALPHLKKSGAAETALLAEAAYSRQISQEIYEGLGKLAKEIHLAIQGLPLEAITPSGMSSPGDGLDQVRSQLSDALEMTEQATLNTLNLVEHIQKDCLTVQGQLRQLVGGEVSCSPSSLSEPQQASAWWSELLTQGAALDRLIRAHAPQADAIQADPPRFALADVLQILLESCGTEAVKPHLKSVWARYESLFQVDKAEENLQQLALELIQEKGVYQMPLDRVLKSLNEACTDERVQELFAKLLASAAKIFPAASLHLEAHPGGGTREARPAPELLALWQEFFATLQNLAGTTRNEASPLDETESKSSSFGSRVQEALETAERIHTSLLHLTEVLACQDLSGQRLLQVLQILRQLQVRVITLLVAAGNKLKVSPEGQEISLTPSDGSGQEALNRMLQSFTEAPPEGFHPGEALGNQEILDQKAVSDLLADLGF